MSLPFTSALKPRYYPQCNFKLFIITDFHEIYLGSLNFWPTLHLFLSSFILYHLLLKHTEKGHLQTSCLFTARSSSII